MRKSKWCYLLAIYFSVFLSSTRLLAECWSLEVRGAYFYPNSKRVRNEFSKIWLDYQVEASKIFCDGWEAWTNVSWSTRHGRHKDVYGYEEERLKLWLLPISAGVKYHYYFLPCASFYMGAGIAYSFLKIEEHFHHGGGHNASKQGVGGVVKLGMRYDSGKYMFIDLFADYYGQSFRFSDFHSDSERHLTKHNLDLSGFKFGFGLGVYF